MTVFATSFREICGKTYSPFLVEFPVLERGPTEQPLDVFRLPNKQGAYLLQFAN